MSQPPVDIGTPEGYAAHKAEMRRIMPVTQRVGLAIVALSALGLIVSRYGAHGINTPLLYASFASLLVGWVILAVVIIKRSAYHRRRTSPV